MNLSPLNYTQHSIAFPTLALTPDYKTDDLTISLDGENGGLWGEIVIDFMQFDGRHRAVRLTAFGDSLDCMYDPRVQRVLLAWRLAPTPDEFTPLDFISLLREEGATPSEYHTRGLYKR